MKTKIGFIGCGIIAHRHISNLSTFSDVQLVAFADVNLSAAQKAASPHDAKAYISYEQMLETEQPDAVFICVPPFAHGPVEAAVIKHKIPFFVEKPISTDLATAENIEKAVSDTGLKTAVGYHWRYLDIVEQARQLLADRPPRLALGYWLDSTPPPTWWRHQSESGGQMVEQTTHIFDLARQLAGEVSSVYAAGSRIERKAFPDSDVDDVSVATLTFASGAVGSFASTCLLNWPHRIGLHLFCEGMAIEITEFEIMIDTGKGRPVTRAKTDPFILEERDFIDAVQGKENKIRTPYADAYKTHKIVLAAAQSLKEGSTIKIS